MIKILLRLLFPLLCRQGQVVRFNLLYTDASHIRCAAAGCRLTKLCFRLHAQKTTPLKKWTVTQGDYEYAAGHFEEFADGKLTYAVVTVSSSGPRRLVLDLCFWKAAVQLVEN